MVSLTVATAAFLSTGAISLAPNVILFFFPSYGAGEGGKSTILSLGQAMSAGALLGDVFLHTLSHDHHSSQETTTTTNAGVWVLIGFTIFLVADMVIRLLDPNSHSHHHDHGDSQVTSTRTEPKAMNGGNHDASNKSSPHVHQSTVLLNLAADALHNFTDGLAIGASYAMYNNKQSGSMSLAALVTSRGGLASISVFLHEIPHELGDFCTLVRAGYSKSQAVLAQFLTAIAAFMGTAVALMMSKGLAGERLVFVSAGGFVYLAATTLLPEVLEDGESVVIRLMQLSFFVTGVLFLYLVSCLESEEEHDHHYHHHEHHQIESTTTGIHYQHQEL